MDYRKVNSYTVNDNNPLPNIQVALEQLHGKTLFSKFDIRWGYNNIRIAEEDQHKAAFKTPFGTYIPRVMYFGLRNAPPFFQRTMHRDFTDLLQQYPQELGNYMDDWWIATTSDKEGRKRHEQIVHAFLDHMEECSYFLKPSKCVFEQDSINILGWIVGQGQVRIDPAKMKGLSEWPRELKTVHDIRQILGLLGYQRPFIRGFAEIACHRLLFRMPLRAGVTGSSSVESYDDDNSLDLCELDANRGSFPPREERRMLYPDLIE
jgi:hypothetical protein